MAATQGSDSAEDILRARFARGEIETAEYKRSLEILRGNKGQTGLPLAWDRPTDLVACRPEQCWLCLAEALNRAEQ